MKVWPSIAVRFAFCAVVAAPGCGRKQADESESFTASTLSLSVIGENQTHLLQETFSSLSSYQPTQPTDTLVILPDANRASLETIEQAYQAVKSGHRVVLFGDAPFSSHYPWRKGLWRRSIRPFQWTPGPALETISDIPIWSAFTVDNQILSSVRLMRTNRVACELFHLEFNDVHQSAWIYRTLDTQPAEPIPSIEFICRSALQGQPFCLKAEDANENQFYSIIPVTEDWQLFRLTPEAFQTPTGKPALTDFNQVQTWSIGYDQQILPFPIGRQTLEISPLFQSSVHLPETSGLPAFPFSGGGTTFTGNVTRLEKKDPADWQFTLSPIGICAPCPGRPTGSPPLVLDMIYGRSPEGQRMTAVTQIRYPELTGGSWIWAGMNLADIEPKVLAELIETIYPLSRRPAVFHHAYPNQFTFDALAPIQITAQAIGFDYLPFRYRIEAQLETIAGRSLSRSSTRPFELNTSAGLVDTRLVLDGIAPMTVAQTDYQIRVLLQNEGAVQRTHDEIVIPIKILPQAPEPDPRLFIRPKANLLGIGRNTVQFQGIIYIPGQRIGPGEDWLSPERFPAEIIPADLDRIGAAGINSLRIPCPSFEYPEQLRYLLEEVYSRGFLTVLKLPPIPAEMRPADLAEFFNTSNLSRSPQVIALELDVNFLEDPKASLDIQKTWETWLREQFGSIPVAVDTAGKGITSAPGINDMRQPETFSYPELLRAFQNDWASRKIGHQVRQLRAAGIQQMITAPVTMGLDGKSTEVLVSGFDVRAVAPHADYLSLSADVGYGSRENVLQGASLGLLARGLAGGKPIVWQDIGSPLPLPVTSRMMGHQKDMHAWELELTRLSQAAGVFGPAYTDYGEVTENRGLWLSPLHPQPALTSYRDHGQFLRNERTLPQPWTGNRISLDTRSGSLVDAWKAQRTGDSRDLSSPGPEVRPEEFRVPTVKMTFERIAEGDAGPLRSVNAEWSWIEIQSKKQLREPGDVVELKKRIPTTLHLLNTGSSTWSSSIKGRINTVWVEIQHDELAPKYLPVPETAFGETAEIKWHPPGYGMFRIRPILWTTGGFGELLEINVKLND